MARLVFHIDVNSAFLSWEAMRRVSRGEKDIRLIPSAIGGDRDKRTGVILAKSIPAKKYGVKTGEPVAMALRKCPELFLAKPDFHLYQKCSSAFIEVCKKYAPAVEQYSIDECFLDMSDTERLYPDPVAVAEKIKNEIRDTLGFTVNVGIGPNKLLAKMASDFEKPDRVHTLFFDELEEKFYPLPVRELFGIGASTAEKLQRINIKTVGDLARLDLASLQAIVGNKFGLHLYNSSRGIDETPVESEEREAKCYGNSVTLEENVVTFERANSILLALSDSVCARMRADEMKTTCVSVTIRSDKFKNSSRQRTLDAPTDITGEVYDVTKRLFASLWDKRTPLRLIGVSLSGITDGEDMQLSLFSSDTDRDKEKSRKVDQAIDSIRNQFGSDMLMRGTTFGAGLHVGQKHSAQIDEINDKD
ncbi:MAG: DNA polymerase IV [Ruminococcaceae bacterium]|nr:DNA polymerase IV [Oscillospiraceae bacterium]